MLTREEQIVKNSGESMFKMQEIMEGSKQKRSISKEVFLPHEFIPPLGTEFVFIINKQGRIEQSIYNKAHNLTKEKKEMFSMCVQLHNSMQSDFDDQFGTVFYTLTERENARFVSIPIPAGVLLAKLDKSIDPIIFVNEIMGMLKFSKL